MTVSYFLIKCYMRYSRFEIKMLTAQRSVIPYCHFGQILSTDELFKHLKNIHQAGQQPYFLVRRKEYEYLGTEFCVKSQIILLCGTLAQVAAMNIILAISDISGWGLNDWFRGSVRA